MNTNKAQPQELGLDGARGAITPPNPLNNLEKDVKFEDFKVDGKATKNYRNPTQSERHGQTGTKRQRKRQKHIGADELIHVVVKDLPKFEHF